MSGDLRAPTRITRPYPRGDNFGAIMLAVGATAGALWFGLNWLGEREAENRAMFERANTAQPAPQAAPSTAQRPAAPPAPVRRPNYYYYYEQPTPQPQRPQKSASQRYDEAIAIMQESRQIQRQIDGPRSVGGAVIVNPGRHPKDSAQCRSLQEQKDWIDARMRRPYTITDGEVLRDRLREIFKEQCRARCINC